MKSAVERSKGLALLFVHPYYTKDRHWDEPRETQHRFEAERTMRRIDSFVASESEVKPPIIIFEEGKNIRETFDHVQSIAPNNSVLITRTFSGAATPELPFSNGAFSPAENSRAWEVMRKTLHYLGIKKILLGGMYLSISEQKDGGQYLDECVGGAHHALKSEFDVEISSFAFPSARKDVHPKGISKNRV